MIFFGTHLSLLYLVIGLVVDTVWGFICYGPLFGEVRVAPSCLNAIRCPPEHVYFSVIC